MIRAAIPAVVALAALSLAAAPPPDPAPARQAPASPVPAGSDPARAAAAAAAARDYRRDNEHRILQELADLLAIPNVADDAPNIARNANRLREMLEARGARVRSLPTAPGRGPVLYGDLPTPGAARTIIFYAHYDGQPVDPAAWTDTSPFAPALRTVPLESGGKPVPFPSPGTSCQDDWRLYARSASDDKSPIVALLVALDALRARRMPPSVNLKFLLDGEEEAGSPHLEATVLANRALLAADALITADGPVHQSGRLLIFFGNRGVLGLQLTVYGPSRALHSGHYGNWAPNPAMRLAQLLASMKSADGRVLVAGFYDDVVPPGPRERQAQDAMPDNDADLLRELALGGADGGGKKLVELINEPSLNVRGLRSAYVGAEAQNIVPADATASLDVRLVKNCAPRAMFDRVAAHVRAQGYFVVSGRDPTLDERLAHARVARLDFEGGYPASATSMDLPVSREVVRAVREVAGDVVLMPTLGGSAPMYIFENLGLPVIGVPIVNHDNNQHAANENLRLGNLWRGIEIYAALMAGVTW